MIVVEIQRTSGCTFAFRDAAKTILRSVSPTKQTRTGPGLAKRRFTIPLSLPKRSKEDLQKCIQDDFQIAYQMISSPKYETQVLGLDSMEQLTRSAKKQHKSGSKEDEVKNVVARSVLGRGSGGAVKDCDTDAPICDCLKQLLLLLDTTAATPTNFQSSSSSSLLLRRKILTVLANSLEVLHSNNSTTCTNTMDTNDRSVILQTMMNTPSFVSVLLSTLQETTPLRPHTAFPAVRCLRYLLLLSSSSLKGEEEEVVIATMRKIHPDAIATVMSACSNGNDNDEGDCHHSHHHHHHEGLEHESKMLMAQLQQKKSTMSL
mmetsp:Transcript_38778/g.43667  ORF Transcript_38778/g.43667 Transcript_38778/m.43667 type:complete len:318 (-) Transcript_38778:53-1006(-)